MCNCKCLIIALLFSAADTRLNNLREWWISVLRFRQMMKKSGWPFFVSFQCEANRYCNYVTAFMERCLYLVVTAPPGDGLWCRAHVGGSSKTEPDLSDGQLHAAGVRWWGHQREVFLQVVWFDTFILQSRGSRGLTGQIYGSRLCGAVLAIIDCFSDSMNNIQGWCILFFVGKKFLIYVFEP